MENNTIPWVEKYRPKEFDDIVLDPINQKLFRNLLDKNHFPNLLFYGPPGTGKTTTIINLINEYQKRFFKINKNLVIHLNASDERGIDIIRNQIYLFIKSQNMFDVGMKFVILDEVDYMTKNAQQALKYLLQTCTQNVRFCLICNYISKIEESLQNEFLCIRFNQLPKQEIHRFIGNISEEEGLGLSSETIETIQTIYSSDIRSMINFIQLCSGAELKEFSEENLVCRKVLEDFHQTIHASDIRSNTSSGRITIKNKIHEMSIQYNCDKKSILLRYFQYLIQSRKYNSQTFETFSEIFHNTDLKVDTFLDFFVQNILKTI